MNTVISSKWTHNGFNLSVHSVFSDRPDTIYVATLDTCAGEPRNIATRISDRLSNMDHDERIAHINKYYGTCRVGIVKG